MHDSFEFREDAARAKVSSECLVQLCPVKWQTAKRAIEFARTGDRRLSELLDQVGLTKDFEPSPVEKAA